MVSEYAPLVLTNAELYLETTDICNTLHACHVPTISTHQDWLLLSAMAQSICIFTMHRGFVEKFLFQIIVSNIVIRNLSSLDDLALYVFNFKELVGTLKIANPFDS